MAKTGAKPSISYETLCGLLGKAVNDPQVSAVLAAAGKVKVTPDHIVAKAAGFEFALKRPEEAKRTDPKLLHTLFLQPTGLTPPGFNLATRAELLASLPPPFTTWKLGEFNLPVTTPDAYGDRWHLNGYDVGAQYRDGAVKGFTVTLPQDGSVGKALLVDPLHFEITPPDALPDAHLRGMSLLLAWAAIRFGLPPKHAATVHGKNLCARTITPTSFFVDACQKKLSTTDFVPELADFLYSYTHRLFGSKPEREAADQAITKLLRLSRTDERSYADDFLGTFRAPDLESAFYVPDTWAAVDRLSAVLDARYADYQATSFRSAPKVTLYEKAAKTRDAHPVEAARKTLAVLAVDDSLATDLVALIERPLSDKAVQAVLKRAGLPVGKKIDEQANPALGVSYLGTKGLVGDKRVLIVESVDFYASKQSKYVRGIGAEVSFIGYPGTLPHGLKLGASRAAATKALGQPKSSREHYDHWALAKNRHVACEFKGDQLVHVRFFKPLEA